MAIKTTTGPLIFGCGPGHLGSRIWHLARREGATLIDYTDPGTGEKRHWFEAAANLGEPFNSRLARAVLEMVRGQEEAK